MVYTNNEKFVVKLNKDRPEFTPQNNLVTEAKVIQSLASLNLSIPTPEIILISSEAMLYCYKFIEGQTLAILWNDLNEASKFTFLTKLGIFHSELSSKISIETARELRITINQSTDLHPEIQQELEELLESTQISFKIKGLINKAQKIYAETNNLAKFHFIHNDAHHENILINNSIISGYLDFGNSEYGDCTKEFSRYIRDLPQHYQIITSAYENHSGQKLPHQRIIAYAFLAGINDLIIDLNSEPITSRKAESLLNTYSELIEKN